MMNHTSCTDAFARPNSACRFFMSVIASALAGLPSHAQPADEAYAPDAERPLLIAPGVLSSTMSEYSPTLDAARGEIYFMRRTPGMFDYRIYTSRFRDGAWTEPTVAPFSTGFRDAGPALSQDARTIVFDSRKPTDKLAAESINLWTATRETADAPWSAPLLLRAASRNNPGDSTAEVDEFGPILDADGTLYFYSFRPPFRGGRHYRIDPAEPGVVLEAPELPDPSASTFVGYLALNPEATFAVIEGRSRTGRDTDLYLSRKDKHGAWSEPEPIDVINTRFGEGTPSLTADGRYLLFGSDRPTNSDAAASGSNLYIISTASIMGSD